MSIKREPKHSSPRAKKLIRRDDRDHSQPLRVTVQILFATLNLWIGMQFYFWVRWAESGGRAFEVPRPAGVEGWLPIEGLMQLKYFLITGKVPHVHAAGFFLPTSFLVIFLDVYVAGFMARVPEDIRCLLAAARNSVNSTS
jgi:hypothetical protein